MRNRAPELGLLFVVVTWASTYVVAKEAFAELSPLAFAGVRFAGIGLLAMAVLAAGVTTGTAQWHVRRQDVPRFVAVGLCGYTLYQLGFVLGLERTSPFPSSLLISCMPVFTLALLSTLGERPPLRAWLGVALALVGAAIFLIDKIGAPESLSGDLLSLGSALSFATYSVLNRPLVKRYPAATYTAYTILVGAVPLVLLSLPAIVVQDWRGVSWATWSIVSYMIVLPVYVAYMVWNWAIAQRGAAVASSYSLLVPLVSGLLSLIAFAEQFDAPKLVGGALVLAGLLVLQRGRTHAADPVTESVPRDASLSTSRG